MPARSVIKGYHTNECNVIPYFFYTVVKHGDILTEWNTELI